MTWWVLTHMRPYPHPTSLSIAATTNNADHLFMAWSYIRPKRSRILRKVRGRWVFCGYLYYWDTPNIAEQIEPGDTLTHHFNLPNLTPLSTIWFYLNAPDGPYGLEIQGPLCHITLPPALAWTKHVMVATQDKGIYITANFSGPEGPHPTWSRHNTRLLDTRILQLHGDLWDPAVRQFALVLVDGTRVLYRREPAAGDFWQWILTNDQAIALTGATGGTIEWVASNLNRPGYIYVLFTTAPFAEGLFCLRSPDYGATWTAFEALGPILPVATGNIMCGLAKGTSEHPAGDVLYLAYSGGVTVTQRLRWSYDNGDTWTGFVDAGRATVQPRCHVDPTNQQTIYLGTDSTIGDDHVLYRSEDYGLDLLPMTTFQDLAILLAPEHVQMWIHPTNNAFMKVLANDHMWQSWDYCETWEDLGEIMVHAEHLHIQDLAPDLLYIGRNESAPLPPDMGWPHVLFASDDHGATLIGKCGAHAQQSDGGGDSIPYDCGGIAFDGILPLY